MVRGRRLVGTVAAALMSAGTLVVLAPPAVAAATFASTAASAGRYGAARIARAGVAVYDRQTGSLWTGGQATSQVSAASTIKVFIAADLLYRNAHHTIRLSSYDYSLMTPMITQSSNSAADYLWKKYGGNLIVRDIIARYRLSETMLSPIAGFWGFTRVTAHDYALFLGNAGNDPSVGPWLTATMSRSQHYVSGFDEWFGIPASGIRPFAIKQGWTCCDTGDILNSTGYVGTKWRYAIAIFTSGSASHHRYYVNEMAKLLLPGGHIPGDPRRNPFGGINTAAATGSTVHIRGWTVDPDRTSTSVTVEISEGSHLIFRAPTNLLRADVNSHYNIRGNHGYDVKFQALNGRHTYCLQYDNIAYGSGNTRTCFARTVNGSPHGVIDSAQARADGSVVIRGWTYDPDSTAQSLQVALLDTGRSIGTFTANAPRADLNHTYNITGNHGYTLTVPHVLDASHTYCVYATNIGPPAPTAKLGCQTLSVANNPFGALDTATGGTGQIELAGWAIDPNSPTTSLTVTVSIDGQAAVPITTDIPRPDINLAYHVSGDHGFHTLLPASPGTHDVTVTVTNLQGGTDLTLPTRTVSTS